MRIAFFTDVYRPTINGVVASIDQFVGELRARGHQVTIICPDYGDDVVDDENDIVRVGSITFPRYKEYRLASLVSAKLEKHMRHSTYDVIHIHSPFAIGMSGITYARRYNLPTVYTAHTSYSDYCHYVLGGRLIPKAAVKKMESLFSNHIDITIAPSAKIARSLEQYGTVHDIVVLPTGVNREGVRGNAAAFKATHGLSGKHAALYLGRLTKEKNLEYLLQAFAFAVHEYGFGGYLILAGDGPYASVLKTLAIGLDIDERTIFTGFLTGQDKAGAYAAADVFCHVSHSETQGLTLLEASALGIPLLVGKDEAYEGIAIDGKNAVVVDGDEEAYARNLVMLMNDKEKRVAYGESGRLIAGDFSVESQTDKLIAVYETALSKKRTQVIYEG